jgi:hypothetical protein
MRERCRDPESHAGQWYAARGIKVCERWQDSFVAFLEDMGECPPGMSIDRIDSRGHYEPGNCRWATPIEQARNSSIAKMNTESVKVVRHLRHVPARLMAALHGVRSNCIYAIRNGSTWSSPINVTQAEGKETNGPTAA